MNINLKQLKVNNKDNTVIYSTEKLDDDTLKVLENTDNNLICSLTTKKELNERLEMLTKELDDFYSNEIADFNTVYELKKKEYLIPELNRIIQDFEIFMMQHLKAMKNLDTNIELEDIKKYTSSYAFIVIQLCNGLNNDMEQYKYERSGAYNTKSIIEKYKDIISYYETKKIIVDHDSKVNREYFQQMKDKTNEIKRQYEYKLRSIVTRHLSEYFES